MPGLQDHLRLALLVDGVQQIKASDISLKCDGKNQPVETLEGLAGKTGGSGMVTITGTCAIPLGGPEFDFESAVANGTYHTLQVPLGVKSYIGNGWFEDAEVSGSVGKSTEMRFTWMGEFKPLR